MSKSLKRVSAALDVAGINTTMVKTDVSRTAQEAAQAVNCHVDQIAKSIILQGQDTGMLFLFLTAGGNQVDTEREAQLAGEKVARADAAQVRQITGSRSGAYPHWVMSLHCARSWMPRFCNFPRSGPPPERRNMCLKPPRKTSSQPPGVRSQNSSKTRVRKTGPPQSDRSGTTSKHPNRKTARSTTLTPSQEDCCCPDCLFARCQAAWACPRLF